MRTIATKTGTLMVSAMALIAAMPAAAQGSSPPNAGPQGPTDGTSSVVVTTSSPPATKNPAQPSDKTASTQSAAAEIVVTARRRAERFQDVPVAVTAISSDTLKKAHVETAYDLQQLAPSLTVSTGFNRWDNFYVIRGMGPTGGATFTGGGNGVVSYFAEVPVSGAGLGLFFDLANVQILNGPQGTLFGKNTTGGVVLFTPQRPTRYFEGSLKGSIGNYGMRSVEGAVNVPLNDAVQLRLAGIAQKRNGFTIDRGPLSRAARGPRSRAPLRPRPRAPDRSRPFGHDR